MMISTKGRYALRVLVDMAEHPSDGYIPLKDIARRQEISEKYLESIVRTLPLWAGLQQVMEQYLSSYTLADLMRRDPDGLDC